MATLDYSFQMGTKDGRGPNYLGVPQVTMRLTSTSDEGDQVETTVRFGFGDAFEVDLRKALAFLDMKREKN